MRNKRILYILLALLALSLAYAYWTFPRQERVTAGRPAATSAPGRAKIGGDLPGESDGTRVRLDLLAREKEKFPGFRQDLFAPLYAAKPVQAPPAPLPPPPVVPPPMPVVAPIPVGPVQPLLPELARFTFLGFLQKEEEKTVFLASAGEIFLVKKGDRFGRSQQFLITGVTPEQLIIQQGDDTRPIMISLVEQAPLAPLAPLAPARQTPWGQPTMPAPGRPFGPSRTGSPEMAPPPPAFEPESEGTGEAPVPEEMPVTGGAEPPTGGNPDGEGLVRPLPRSDFNNLFSSSGNGRRPEAPSPNPGAPTANEVRR